MPIPDEVDDLHFQATSLSHSTEHSHASIRHAQRRLRATGLSVEKILEAMPIFLEEARANGMSLTRLVDLYARLVDKTGEKPVNATIDHSSDHH